MRVGALLWLALRASSPQLEPPFVWEAPLSCPDEREVIAATERYLGRPRSADDADVSVQASVRARGSGYRLELAIQRGDAVEQHSIDGASCTKLSEIAAGLTAIAIDPLALGRSEPIVVTYSQPVLVQRPRTTSERAVPERPALQRPSSTPPPPQPAETPSERAPEAEQALPPEPAPVVGPTPPASEPGSLIPELGPLTLDIDDDAPRDRPERPIIPPRALILASGAAAIGVFPNISPGVRGGLGFERRTFRIELDAGGWFAGRFRSGQIGGDLRAAELALHPCWVPRWRYVELRTCGAGGAGWVRAEGVGVTSSRVLRQPWAYVAAELGLAVVVERRVAIFLDLGAAINLARPTFWVDAPDARYVMPLASGRGRLGIEVRLP